jgi:hypothetical protein
MVNNIYNDETKEIQLLFRVMIQLGIFADNVSDLAQTFNHLRGIYKFKVLC